MPLDEKLGYEETDDEVYDKRWKNVRVQQHRLMDLFSQFKNYLLLIGIVLFLWNWVDNSAGGETVRSIRSNTQLYAADYVNNEYGMGDIATTTGIRSWWRGSQKLLLSWPPMKVVVF